MTRRPPQRTGPRMRNTPPFGGNAEEMDGPPPRRGGSAMGIRPIRGLQGRAMPPMGRMGGRVGGRMAEEAKRSSIDPQKIINTMQCVQDFEQGWLDVLSSPQESGRDFFNSNQSCIRDLTELYTFCRSPEAFEQVNQDATLTHLCLMSGSVLDKTQFLGLIFSSERGRNPVENWPPQRGVPVSSSSERSPGGGDFPSVEKGGSRLSPERRAAAKEVIRALSGGGGSASFDVRSAYPPAPPGTLYPPPPGERLYPSIAPAGAAPYVTPPPYAPSAYGAASSAPPAYAYIPSAYGPAPSAPSS